MIQCYVGVSKYYVDGLTNFTIKCHIISPPHIQELPRDGDDDDDDDDGGSGDGGGGDGDGDDDDVGDDGDDDYDDDDDDDDDEDEDKAYRLACDIIIHHDMMTMAFITTSWRRRDMM